jgi:hypothetical protein
MVKAGKAVLLVKNTRALPESGSLSRMRRRYCGYFYRERRPLSNTR